MYSLEKYTADREKRVKAESKRVHVSPDWYAPYQIAQAYRAGDILYQSGQAACADDGSPYAPGDIRAQAKRCFEQMNAVLEKAGGSLDNVIKLTIYLTDMSNMAAYYEVYNSYFSEPWPAATLVEVSSLALPELMIEIDATANLASVRQN